MQPTVMGLPWFAPHLNHTLYGRRLHEIIAIGAGTGVGKTELLAKQIHYDLTVLKEPVGVFLLEQQPGETVKRLASTHAGKQFHVPNRDPENPTWTTEELSQAIAEIEDERLFMYDSFGATDWEVIKTTIRYLAHSEGIRLFYIDHLTALAAMEEEERTGLERIMSEMGALVQELPITIHLVSHLATPEGKPHEEGGRVMIRHFKGSRAIGFWCFTMLGLERDQQHKDDNLRCVTTVRVLKHRPVGSAVGETVFCKFDRETGRYVELDHDPFEVQNDDKDYGFDVHDEVGADPGF
jgi:twinkle protein